MSQVFQPKKPYVGLQEAKSFLMIMKGRNEYDQRIEKQKIIEAFRSFWFSNPSEPEFAVVCGEKLIFFPEMLYIMARVDPQLFQENEA